MPKLKDKIEKLPPELQKEVDDFIEFLVDKYNNESSKKLKQDWAGGLEKYKDKYTSIELQKKANEWRSE